MHDSVLAFGRHCAELLSQRTDAMAVLEVGSLDVNGSLRQVFAPLASHYLGVDIVAGPGVDQVVGPDSLCPRTVRPMSRELVICTETLEHASRWKSLVLQCKVALVPGGYLLVTTRAPGFPFHHPPDRWRFPREVLAQTFSDLIPALHELGDGLRRDPQHPGWLGFWRKPIEWSPVYPSRQHNVNAQPTGPWNAPYDPATGAQPSWGRVRDERGLACLSELRT